MDVNLGSNSLKRKPFFFNVDSSTSANFGEVLPLFCTEIVPNSSSSVRISDAVRFAPLSFPTFGRAYLKTYSFCHKISDLYPPFNDLLARTPYTSSSGSTYVPDSVPYLPLWFLYLTVLTNCEFSIYSCETFKEDAGAGTFNREIVNFDIVSSLAVDESPETMLTPDDIACSFPYWLLLTFNSSIKNSESYSRLTTFYNNFFGGTKYKDLIFFDSDASNIGCLYNPPLPNPFGVERQPVTPDSADFVIKFNPSVINRLFKYNGGSGVTSVEVSNLHEISPEHTQYDQMMFCIRLNDSGKYLRKILMGLGYQISPCDSLVSILPLYAYFKSYFDTFAPKRFIKFEQTYFAKLINSCVQSGQSLFGLLCTFATAYSDSSLWSYVVDDLLSCFYTKDTDYYSSQIIGLINNYGNSVSQKYLGVDTGGHVLSDSIDNRNSANGLPYVDLSSNVSHTQAQQNILSRLTQFVNRRSLAGGKIASFLKSVFGISGDSVYDSDNSFVGCSSIDVDFSDVFSTAETSEGSLGEYAGKAMAFTQNADVFKFDTSTHSLFLAFSVVVPRTQYVQGVNPILYHYNPSDFYNPLYDGLTLLPTRVSSLFASPFNSNGFAEKNTSFGNQTIFAEYKIKSQGVLNGDLSLRSTRSTYDSFTMDELISGAYSSDISYGESSDSNSFIPEGYFRTVEVNPTMLKAGTMWRYLGRWLWLGRFDRIFVNNRFSYNDFESSLLEKEDLYDDVVSSRNLLRSDDNLVIHHVVDLRNNSPMVPLSGSYMTDDLLSLDPSGVKIQSE